MELKGFVKLINELDKWKEFTSYIPAAKLMDLKVGQKYPLMIDGKDIGNSEIVRIDGEKVTFRIPKEVKFLGS